MDRWIIFLFFLTQIFSDKIFSYKMTNLTYSGDNNFKSKENIKDNIIKIFIFYSVLSFIIFALSIANVRLLIL